jgi:hypothetical protein
MPAVAIIGQTLEFTQQGVGYSGEPGPVKFHGNGHNMQDPSNPLVQAALVESATEGVVTIRFRFDGSIYQCVN